jgi:RNA recognition motif-containing protein
MLMRLDRFTFQNEQRCFIEFASEEQAQKAVETLHNTEFMYRNILVSPLKENFVWKSTMQRRDGRIPRLFNIKEISASEAAKPLLEGRRKMFSIQPPGWGYAKSSVGHTMISNEYLEEHLGKFGIECFGPMRPYRGSRKSDPSVLCFIDFTTKSGADQAVQAINNTEILGRKVWLTGIFLEPWRAHQIGKLDQALLGELQAKGVASTEPYEDNFVN